MNEADALPAPAVLYLFCVARGDARLQFGEQDKSVAFRWRDLIAVCEWTTEDRWSGPHAEERMRDLKWLAPRAVHHESVIEYAMRISPVLPARLGTLFSSAQALQRFLQTHQAAIESFLRMVEGRQEWSLRALLDRECASRWLAGRMAAEESQGREPSAGGTNYLRQRRAHVGASRQAGRWAAKTLEPIVGELRHYADSSCKRNPNAGAADGRQPILNIAFLVAREKLAGFRRCAEDAAGEHRAHGLDLQLTGPWPPYSFCPALEMPP